MVEPLFGSRCNPLFDRVVLDYHTTDSVDAVCPNPYEPHSIEGLLYRKNWIDTVQWHLEDIIRNPHIDPTEALQIKRRIDKSNQDRTDLVELLDDWFFEQLSGVEVQEGAGINTETPAWAVDRLSILALKIFHMRIEAERTAISEQQKAACSAKLGILLTQRQDLTTAIDQLVADLCQGRKYMKRYKQMKMYNDPLLNPVLYARKG